MDETETYQQRVQAIAEKRRIKEEEENVRRKTEEERLKLAQHKRKFLREQWLMETTRSSAEDPKLQSAILTSQTESHSSEREMRKEADQTKNMDKETSQIGENEPSIHSADNIEKPVEVAYLKEEKRNVLEVEVERVLLSQAAQEYTEEKREIKTEEQEVHHLAVALTHYSLQPNVTPNEADDYLADRKTELIMPEGGIEVEEDEWEMVNCSPEEGLDLTQTHTDSSLAHEGDGAVLKVAQVFILNEEEELEICGESVVLNIVVAEKSDLEETSCESRADSSTKQTPSDVALKTLSFDKGAHGDIIAAPLQKMPDVS
ncbi:paralemmin-1-like isoform X1, partial [Clarias magur]